MTKRRRLFSVVLLTLRLPGLRASNPCAQVQNNGVGVSTDAP
jgi:hypothetical protein